MQRGSRLLGRLEGRDDLRVHGDRSVAAGAVDARELLEHHAPRADVEVAHLRVAHLPLRQAHGLAGGRQARGGRLGEQAVEHRRCGQRDGVARARLGQAEAVHDDKACGKGKVFG